MQAANSSVISINDFGGHLQSVLREGYDEDPSMIAVMIESD